MSTSVVSGGCRPGGVGVRGDFDTFLRGEEVLDAGARPMVARTIPGGRDLSSDSALRLFDTERAEGLGDEEDRLGWVASEFRLGRLGGIPFPIASPRSRAFLAWLAAAEL